MTIPNYQEIMLPLLQLVADGKEFWIQDCFDVLADHFHLTEEERSATRTRGETVFSNRVRWAKTYMAQAGLIETTRRGYFRITKDGNAVLSNKPTTIDNAFLKQFPAFVAFMQRSSKNNEKGLVDHVAIETNEEQTPEEQIEEASSAIEDALRSSLITQICGSSPAFFEKLILDLMVAMKYGDSTQHVGKTGDGGIDGIINQDALGLDVIYLQAKRYQPDTTIPVETIRGFSGALTGRGATKGVFVCTCKFTSAAKDFALNNRLQKIVLIDGHDLTQLMIKHSVGVRTTRAYEIKKIDVDYFEEYDLS